MKPRFENPACGSCEARIKTLFCHLDDSELSEFSLRKTCNFYKKGQTIFYERNKPLGIFCISEGRIKVHKLGDTGKDQIVRLAKEGDILGYRAIVSGEYYTASATALKDSKICFIPKSTFFDLLQTNSEFSMKLVQLLSNDLKTAETKITHLAQKPVKERLAETLLVLKEFYGVESDGETLNVSMTREEIANIVGTATETIIRLLSEFKKGKIIALQGRKLKILHHASLVKTANVYD